ncbi:MAG: phenylalanine--tRNA ligase subunit alpha [Candidatus Tokpelaia sp.]|uniref:phenylalanine--tRNA ligase subunit alpha n=1 Tax=Candidatus Tokpelaia sp. TaxID=2233777 RepID=UPI00123C541D|nr:MAG: phenylalanine--tRNA ligase subunit alpha [Candidatus Tokpelaia sp.]KAA6204915.1 MAG: phenylalanine--tRNA ligase subunit alpha [Candidatus Tokpelaia sp.]KAA6405607.1 phenylalanine--tRNA ligase subunit alpha [Candidatus Tokpelaia sp.]
MSRIQELEQDIAAALARAATIEDIDLVRVYALGKKGRIAGLLKSLGAMSALERQQNGPVFNGLKMRVQEAIEAKRAEVKAALLAKRLETERVDVTLPVRLSPIEQGRIHPISQIMAEVAAIFADMGFSLAEGPDIETDYYNFTALNFPEGHPAREMHDSFFMQNSGEGGAGQKADKAAGISDAAADKGRDARGAKPGGGSLAAARPVEGVSEEKPGSGAVHTGETVTRLLRTHTSPVQIRTMEKVKPPLRIIIPGRTYRMDSDATHSPMFHQLEGLVIDKGANIANMMWVLERFCALFFEVPAVKMRFRPSFFPFTEPSMEVDIQCDRSGAEIKFGQGRDWLEILGCGMVHPNILRAGLLDPEEYQGFAWGMGLDRLAMLKYGMPDLRAFFEADWRWLQHYGFRPLDMA